MAEGSIKDKIARFGVQVGSGMALFGLASSILYFLDYNLRILMWVDLWGPTMGWLIRAGLIVGGGVLFVAAKAMDSSESPEARAAEEQARADAWNAVKNHPRTQQLMADMQNLVRASWDPPADPNTYQVRQVVWQDAQHRWTNAQGTNFGPDDPGVTNVLAFLERAAAPERIVVGQVLATRQLTQQDAHPGTWSTMVGG
jgi:hypothetical protein